MIGDAVAAATAIGWALLAWTAVFAVVCTPVVLAVGAAVGWAARTAWRGLTRLLTGPQPSGAPRVHHEPNSPSRAHTEPQAWKEAA